MNLPEDQFLDVKTCGGQLKTRFSPVCIASEVMSGWITVLAMHRKKIKMQCNTPLLPDALSGSNGRGDLLWSVVAV